MHYRNIKLLSNLAILFVASGQLLAREGALRVGIVGCDTSHVTAFATLTNDPEATGPRASVQVTVAFPGGSPDIAGNQELVAKYVGELRGKGVAVVSSPKEVAEQADAILLESVDGRVHLEQFKAIAIGKPVFVDKPAAASLADLLAIYRHADQTKTPVFSSSALRFCSSVQQLRTDSSKGEIFDCLVSSPLTIEPHHPDLFWYGIHGVESLVAIMGAGCVTVSRRDSETSCLVVGVWQGGRLGSYRGLKKRGADYSFELLTANGIKRQTGFSGYEPLVDQICQFLMTGQPPVDRNETIEILAFMEAADESKRLHGAPVSIKETIKKAEQSLEQKSVFR